MCPSSVLTYEYSFPPSFVQKAYTSFEPARWSAAGRHQPESGSPTPTMSQVTPPSYEACTVYRPPL